MNGLVVFPTFFNLSEFDKKRVHDVSHSQLPFMLLVTVQIFSIFRWLGGKNRINLILVFTIKSGPFVETFLVL